MKNELVIIDAGHGGIDSGAVGNGLEEKDLTLDISRYMFNRLQQLGIPAVITREDDEYLPKDKRIQRIKEITKGNPNTLLVSNHINAGGGEGAEVVYSLNNNPTFANMILDNIGDKGQIKRKVYQRRLPENPNKDYYYILRETGTKEPVLIEYGFIDNTKDAAKLKRDALNYAEGVVEAIAEYLGYPYNTSGENTQGTYTVQKGDTLYSISRRFNIPVEEIKRLNNLTSDILSVGQVLNLTTQSTPTQGQYYTVEKGDTLYAISRKFDIPIEDIIEANNLTTSTLSIGQQLYIPVSGEMDDDGNFGDNDNNNNTDAFMIYEVKKGDSLWLISREFDITVPELIDINNLTDLTIYVGQKLLVPNRGTIGNTYIVEPGDTLWSISKKFDLTVDELKELNGLTSNLLSVGQELIVK